MEKRGRKPLEMARKAILEEEIESKEVEEALHYFMTKYWQDLARPTLMSICCEAVGGDSNATIPFAVPLSLISGALDIQDDIIDQSKTKHGQPTVYGKYGKEIAILTADALLFKGFTLLYEACANLPKGKAERIMKTIKDMFYELGDAEALELKIRGRIDVTPEEYLYIIRKKAADVEVHTFIGAIIGNGKGVEQASLRKYGRYLGMLLIIRDDVIDICHPEEIVHRFKNEHLPLPIIYSLSYDQARISVYVQRIRKVTKIVSKGMLKNFLGAIDQTKGFFSVQKVMEDITESALSLIEKIGKNKEILQQLLQLLDLEVNEIIRDISDNS